MNAPFNLRQIAQYPSAVPQLGDLMLLQTGGLGGPYMSAQVADLLDTAFTSGQILSVAGITLPAAGVIGWANDAAAQVLYGGALGGQLAFTPSSGWRFDYANPQTAITLARLGPDGNLTLELGTVSVARGPALPGEVVTLGYLQCCGVTSFNGRHGDIQLASADVYSALQLHGTVATQEWVNATIFASFQAFQTSGQFVYSFNGRTGAVTLTADDITLAATAPGAQIQANSPVLGDASSRVATTLFVDESMDDLEQRLLGEIGPPDLSSYAPLNSPNLTGIPTAPTANPGTHTGQIATTAFVQAAVTASTTGVSSFNTRTGAITLLIGDITGAGGAPVASPALTGTPTAPTAAPATSTTQIATTAFVAAAISAIGAGVVSFNGRAGSVTLTTADVTGAGGAPIAGPSFTGAVTAPTPAPASNNTTVATTAYVTAAIAALGPNVSSFNGRTGAVTLLDNDISAAGGALIASPTFTGVPAAPTAVNGTNTTQIATCAFVLSEIGALASGVSSFNTRTGAVTLITADITGAGGAPIASPALTGTPTAPTAAGTSNDTTIATTAFVKAAIAAAGGVTSFNSRTGAVTLSGADVSAAGGALLASPTFTGTPAGPTATAGTSTTQLATTQFVMNQLTTGAVTSFNGRNGAVTLTAADLTGVGGALLASPAFTGTPNAPTATAGTSNTQIATTAFVQAAVTAASGTPGWTFALTGGVSTQTATGGGTVLNIAGGTGTTTWNPADLANATLSGGNLSVIVTTASGGVRSVFAATSGKWYFEASNSTGSAGQGIGIANASASFANTGVSQAVCLGNGQVSVGGVNQANIGASGIVGVAFDMGAGRVWFRRSPAGAWNAGGTADPATGVGGYSIAGLTGGISALYAYYGTSAISQGTTTANFGASAFSGVVPAGYSPLGASGNDTYKIANKNGGSIIQVQDNTSESGNPANSLVIANGLSGQPSIISTLGTDTSRSIQFVPAGTGTVQAPTMTAGDNSTAIATTAFVTAKVAGYLPLAGGTLTGGLALGAANNLSVGGVTYFETSVATANDFYISASSSFRTLNFQGTNNYNLAWNVSTGMLSWTANGATALSVDYTGILTISGATAYKPGGGSWTAPSDARIKHVFGKYDQGLDDVIRLEPVRYMYRGNDGAANAQVARDRREFVGLVAQDVEGFFPGMVRRSKGKIDGVDVDDLRELDNGELIYAVVNSIKELATRIAVLEAKL